RRQVGAQRRGRALLHGPRRRGGGDVPPRPRQLRGRRRAPPSVRRQGGAEPGRGAARPRQDRRGRGVPPPRPRDRDRGLRAGRRVGPSTTLGSTLADEKRFPEAEATLRRGLAIAEKALPPEHPWTTAALRALGDVLTDTGRADDAMPLLERALRSRVAENGD